MTEPRKFRRKPVVVEAMHWDGGDPDDVLEWIDQSGGSAWFRPERPEALIFEAAGIVIDTLEGPLNAWPDWWIIRGVKGEFYACEPEIFALIYEEVEGEVRVPPAAGS